MRYDAYNGQITIEGETLTLSREGMVARATYPPGTAWVMPVAAIASVEVEVATLLRNGWLRILVPGSTPGTVTRSNAASAGDTILFTHSQGPLFGQVYEWLAAVSRQNHANAAAGLPWPAVPAPPTSRADALAAKHTPPRAAAADAPVVAFKVRTQAAEPSPAATTRAPTTAPRSRPKGAPPWLLHRRGWYAQAVAGESHYEAHLRKITRRGEGEREVTALLVRDPKNKYDKNAVQVLVDGGLVGFLPKEDAPAYHPAIALVESRGFTATAAGRLWWSSSAEWFSASVSLDLDDPALLVAVNSPDTSRPHLIVPAGSTYQVSGEAEHLDVLGPWLARGYAPGKALAWAALTATTVATARSNFEIVSVSLDGEPIGTLSKQTSAKLLPYVRPLTARGVPVYCEAVLTGNALAIEATVSLTPTEKLPPDTVAQIAALTR